MPIRFCGQMAIECHTMRVEYISLIVCNQTYAWSNNLKDN